MISYLQRRLKIHQLTTALFLIFAISAKNLKADTSSGEQTKAETKSNPFHLSWTSNTTRLDFVFILKGNISDVVKLESDPDNFLTNSLKSCIAHSASACLFKNGTYIESFHAGDEKTHETVFKPVTTDQTTTDTKSSSKECDNGNQLKIVHYCTTHWNPPNYLTRSGCNHLIEWHSPITCHLNTTNHERPCYIYESSGKLIDLTPWVLSNGTSYEVDTSGSTIKKFNVNICNEAHVPCGPNVAACFIDEHTNHVESGYNDLTSIKYDAKGQAVLLTYLGGKDQHCDGSRIKTVIHFICENKIMTNSRPKLIRSTACEKIIEWPSVHACPVSDVKIAEQQCSIRHPTLGLDIDIRKITNNQTQVVIPGIQIDGEKKTMKIGICEAIDKKYKCEGKSNSNTKACLIDFDAANSEVWSASNSKIVGSVMGASIKLSDGKIYLESYAKNSTCSENVRGNFSVTQKVGTRIEFVCSSQSQDKPTFLGYDDCTYVFEWGSPLMCLEASSSPATVVQANQTKNAMLMNFAKQFSNINIKDVIKSGDRKYELKKQDVVSEDETSMELNKSNTPLNNRPKMNGIQKFFMMSLIVMSFAAFIIIILVLDKKTRLRVTLGQARQAFQPNQQPYSRVVDDLDL